MGTTVIAWVVALGGWAVALFEYYLGCRERRGQRDQDLLAKTLSYFEGGTQKRSIGIALTEGVWARKMRQMDILVPVLINQTVYLLLCSDSRDGVHEERNLIRLLRLLERCIPHTTSPSEHYPEILDALVRKYCREKNAGVDLPSATIRSWYRKLGGDVEQLEA